MKDFKYEIVEKIAVISFGDNNKKTLELNLISYNGGKPKFDLRRWDNEGKRQMLKGITLNEQELSELKRALRKVDLSDRF